jgi:hypothetical protein
MNCTEELDVVIRIPESLDFSELAEMYGDALKQSLESTGYGEIGRQEERLTVSYHARYGSTT